MPLLNDVAMAVVQLIAKIMFILFLKWGNCDDVSCHLSCILEEIFLLQLHIANDVAMTGLKSIHNVGQFMWR